MELPKWEIFFISLVALALLFADRWIRLSMILNQGIENYTQKCGINMRPCPGGMACANGYCISTARPALAISNLPIYP